MKKILILEVGLYLVVRILSTPQHPIMSATPSTPAEPTLVPTDHAKRFQDVKIPDCIVQALKLTPQQVRELYVSDSQAYSNNSQLVQLHFKTDTPSPEVQKYRGWVLQHGGLMQDNQVTVRAMSFPYLDPIIADELPAGFEQARFSHSRQGFVARVFCPYSKVNISTHRKIDCERSRFGQSIPMKEMFEQAAQAKGFDYSASKLFGTREAKLYCHVFFVSHDDMRLIPTDEQQPELIYLGSLKSQVKQMTWAELNESEDEPEDEPPRLVEMTFAEPNIPELEALRPVYYTHAAAVELFQQGQPLIAWVDGQPPTRLVPSGWDRKEQIRGNTPNLKLAWYKLLDSGNGDRLLEVLPASKHHLLDDFREEMWQMLDGKTHRNKQGKLLIKGPPQPTAGSLIKHLVDLYFKLHAEADQDEFLEGLGKATAPVVKLINAYARKMVGLSVKDKTRELARFVRSHLWHDIKAERLYTLIAEFKRATAPPNERSKLQ